MGRLELMGVPGTTDQHAGKAAVARIQPQAGLGPDPAGGLAVYNVVVGMHLAQCHLAHRDVATVAETGIDETRFCDTQHVAQFAHRRIGFRHRRLQHQTQRIDTQNFGDLAAQIGQERIEFRRIEHFQNRAMHLIGTRQVLIGGGNYVAVGVLQPLQPGIETVHRYTAQIDDIVSHDLFVSGNQCTHQVTIVENNPGFGNNFSPQIFRDRGGRAVAHACLFLFFILSGTMV